MALTARGAGRSVRPGRSKLERADTIGPRTGHPLSRDAVPPGRRAAGAAGVSAGHAAAPARRASSVERHAARHSGGARPAARRRVFGSASSPTVTGEWKRRSRRGDSIDFEVVIDSRLVGFEKPDPRIFQAALEPLGIAAGVPVRRRHLRSGCGWRPAGRHGCDTARSAGQSRRPRCADRAQHRGGGGPRTGPTPDP